MKILSALLVPILLLSGCASVTVSNINSQEYLVQRRGDVISQGRLSDPTNTVLTALGLSDCENRVQYCINSVGDSSVTDNESKISALAEMWLFKAMRAQKDAQVLKDAGEFQDENKLNAELLNDYIQTAKYSYAYLFFSGRKISDRALEDRQTQVKDYYNFAVQNVIEQLYRATKGKALTDFPVREGKWNIYIKNPEQLSEHAETVKELIPDTVLSFKGLKNQYSADGLGARMVLSTDDPAKEKDQPWRLMPYSSVTAMISFPGKSLNQILTADDVVVSTYDPSFVQSVKIGKTVVPLSANFSGAYGLWLANSDFASNALSTIFGHGNIIDKPTVYLMRPYRKDLRTIILIHGLASSPEAIAKRLRKLSIRPLIISIRHAQIRRVKTSRLSVIVWEEFSRGSLCRTQATRLSMHLSKSILKPPIKSTKWIRNSRAFFGSNLSKASQPQYF